MGNVGYPAGIWKILTKVESYLKQVDAEYTVFPIKKKIRNRIHIDRDNRDIQEILGNQT